MGSILSREKAVLCALAAFLVTVFLFCGTTLFAEQAEIENSVFKEQPRYIAGSSQKLYGHSMFEYGWVKQGARKGKWKVSQNRVALLRNNMPALYLDYTYYERLGLRDNTIDLGSYIKLPDGSVNFGVGYGGFGADLDFIYRFKAAAGIEYKLYKTVFANMDFRYLHYPAPANDAYIFTPGLIYYFGNHYISANYGLTCTIDRGVANFGTVKGAFVITDRLSVYGGTAFGERLYDIFPLRNASKQGGYILFAGLEIKILDSLKFRVGGSYSEEKPSFIKRSLEAGGILKF